MDLNTHADTLWLGSYTPDASGQGAGITALEVREDRTLAPLGTLAEDSPSFLAAHPRRQVVYAALEIAGAVQAYRRTARGRLSRLGGPVAAGKLVCHLAVTADGAALLASCYGDGRVLLYPLAEDGAIAGPAREVPASVDPHRSAALNETLPEEFGASALMDLSLGTLVAQHAPERPSRAHATAELPDGRIASTDLGHDAVRVWRRTRAGALALDHTVALPLGVGPRHLVTHPSGHVHVITEYSTEVFTLGRHGESWRLLAGIPAVADGIEEGDHPSELSRSASGAHLYASIRGSNRLSAIAVGGDGAQLRAIGDRDCGGENPRHHLVNGGLIHVANQDSHRVSTFRLEESGRVGAELSRLDVGSPSALLPAPPEPRGAEG